MEALSSIGVISAFIFAFAFNLWFEFDDQYFEDNKGVHTLFCIFLALSTGLSGIATATMTAHYYTWKTQHQLLLLKITKTGMQRYLEYLYHTSFVRQLSRFFAVLSFITLYITLMVYGYAKFIISNDFTSSYYAACLGIILPSAILTILGVINVTNAHGNFHLFDCCGNNREGQDLVVFMTGTAKILNTTNAMLDNF